MNAVDTVFTLSDKEKIDLAAKLTSAAMSALNYDPALEGKTQQKVTKIAADRAYMIFGYFLEKITSGNVPLRFPEEG